jgi:hypothetical protein
VTVNCQLLFHAVRGNLVHHDGIASCKESIPDGGDDRLVLSDLTGADDLVVLHRIIGSIFE